MVRPPKPNEMKENIPVRKSNLKPDLEERFRTEAPLHKKIISDKLKSSLPGTSLQDKVKAKNLSATQKTKSASPKTSKVGKTASQQPTTTVKKRDSVAVSQSHVNKPATPGTQKRTKTRKASITKKKSPVEAKSNAINRLLKIAEAEDQTSLPIGEQFTNTNEEKIKNKMGKVVAGAKKVIKKSSLKQSPKEESKNLTLNLKQDDSVASLTTHFRMPYLPSELTATQSTSPKNVSVKKRKTSTIQKKIVKSKADQEDDNTKEAKNKRKSKLHSSKLIDRVLSSDSVPVFSLREIKHNDSFIISARKLQKSTRERRNSKLDCLKLSERTSSFTRAKTEHLPLKSCLKKSLEGASKIGEHLKTEGKMKLLETFHPTQIISTNI